MGIKLLLQENRAFFILYSLLLILGAYPLFKFDKVALFLQLNHFNHPILDQLFYYITFLGSGAMYVLLMATLVVIQLDNRTLLTGVCSFVAVSVIVQGMKRVIFADQLRPVSLLSENIPLHLIEGVVPTTHFSFPSGHAATAFAAVCYIHLSMSKKPIGYSILLLFCASIVAYTRIYLCQHFYRDIYVGACIGTWTTVLVHAILKYWQGPAWLDQKFFAGKGVPWGSNK